MADVPPGDVLCEVAQVLQALSALCDEAPDRFPSEGIGVLCRWMAERIEDVAAPMLDARL
jgi:hypothetical protein